MGSPLLKHARFSIGSVVVLPFATLLCIAAATRLSLAHEPATAVDSKAMRVAVLAWREALGPELARKASFDFDGKERTDWHFVPKDRVGVNWAEMNLEQRRAAHALLRTALSSQ